MQPVAGPRFECVQVEHRDGLRRERSEQPELGVQQVEHVASELAADGQEELAVEVAPAQARELKIPRQGLCQVYLDVECSAPAVRFPTGSGMHIGRSNGPVSHRCGAHDR
jgi:hypothetical protein